VLAAGDVTDDTDVGVKFVPPGVMKVNVGGDAKAGMAFCCDCDCD
jgi:hypothetical protein